MENYITFIVYRYYEIKGIIVYNKGYGHYQCFFRNREGWSKYDDSYYYIVETFHKLCDNLMAHEF